MSIHMPLIRALLRKDLQMFWLFALLTGLLMGVLHIPAAVEMLGAIAGLVRMVLQLAAVMLVLLVMYEDAVVSVRHDWLTRPLPGPALLTAKLLFVVLVLVVPAALGTLVYELWQGHSILESLLAAVGLGASGSLLLSILVVMACGAVTGNIRQAMVLAATVAVVLGLLAVLAHHVGDIGGAFAMTGSVWMLFGPMQLLLAAAAVMVLWVQYRHRHTRAARIIATTTAVLLVALLLSLTRPRILALQQSLSREPEAAQLAQVALAEGCLPARWLGADSSASTNNGSGAPQPQDYEDVLLERAGARPLAFASRLVEQQVPAGNRVVVDHVDITYRAAGRPVGRLDGGYWPKPRKRTADGQWAIDHSWLLPAAEYERLRQIDGVETVFNYSLSLLAPTATATFAADGRRRHFAGIGYCSADMQPERRRIVLDCFRAGPRAALFSAVEAGAEQATEAIPGFVDYRPALLDFWGGQRLSLMLPATGEAAQITVTAYAPRVHFARQLAAAGVLGGPLSACAAP